MNEKCNDKSPIPPHIIQDVPPPICDNPGEPNLRQPAGRPDLGWLEDVGNQKTGFGAQSNCDPMSAGRIINDPAEPNREVSYRYARSIRGTDEAIMDLFTGLVVLDEDGKPHKVPIIWGTQERAVAAVVQDNFRKDETLVVDRIRLPIMAVANTQMAFNQQRYCYSKALDYMRDFGGDEFKPGFTKQERHVKDTIFGVARGIPVDISYTLWVWTMYLEDMNQIIEQILPKFNPMAYIRIRGIPWVVDVRLDSIANNLDFEPGDQAIRVVKYEFNLTAESYIAQPIVRKKAVLNTKVELVDGLSEEDITQVMGRLEEAVKELEC